MKWRKASLIFVAMGWGMKPCFAWAPQDLIALARETVKCQALHQPLPLASDSDAPLPVFVTIERHGKVVGCRGSLRATQSSLQREVARAARSATAFDPRYRPLSPDEVRDFLVTVTVVHRQMPLAEADLGSLAPEEGLVLQSGERLGIVLPFEGRDPRVRLGWAFKKAGVSPGASVRLFRLEAERFRG